MTRLSLPTAGGELQPFTPSGNAAGMTRRRPGDFSRVAFAAAHVVADPLADCDPWIDTRLDWDATLAFRHRLWDQGFAVAEAMDTAQRGMGLGWPEARELIVRSVGEAATRDDAVVFSGVGTDHLPAGASVCLEDIVSAYEQQIEAVEAVGGRLIVMASRALAATARGADDYATVYARLLEQVREPVIIHWLGDMFDPALAGYWGSGDVPEAMATCLKVIADHADKVDGVKISLLSADYEIEMRRRLPDGVRMYSGDDFNYAALIAGDAEGYSDALLGIFDAIAPAASDALAALAKDDLERFHAILGPTVPLSRHIFKAPTRFYKTGVVFIAWLNGFQDHFTMVGGQQSARSLVHLAELLRLADEAGVLFDPDLAAARMKSLLAVHGIA